jgi:hypothetical protein
LSYNVHEIAGKYPREKKRYSGFSDIYAIGPGGLRNLVAFYSAIAPVICPVVKVLGDFYKMANN